MASSSRSCSSLPEDILIEIFIYLPRISICRFKSVSKVWLSILSNPSFIIRWFKFKNKSLPWVQYHSITNEDADDHTLRLSSGNAYPDLDSQLESRDDYGFSFEFLRNEKPFQGAKLYPIGSSNGLVLCYSLNSDDDQRKYHVCNPLTKKWVSLPSPPHSVGRKHNVNGIFCENSSSCCYKVVRIPRCHDFQLFNIDMFCSDLGEWRSFEVSCDQDVSKFKISNGNAVTLDGVFFWMGECDKMLVYNLNQNESDGHRCSSVDLPFPRYIKGYEWDFGIKVAIYLSHTLGVSEGWLCYARSRLRLRKLTVSVWMLDVGSWKLLHNNIKVHDNLAEICCRKCGVEYGCIRVLGFSPVDRNVVFLGCERWIWWYNIQTRNFEELGEDLRVICVKDEASSTSSSLSN